MSESEPHVVTASHFTVTNVAVQVPDERVRSLLCCAFENGIRYWARIDKIDYGEYSREAFRRYLSVEWPQTIYNAPFVDGCAVHIEEYGDDNVRVATYRLDRAAIQRGLQLMATDRSRCPVRHWLAFCDENEDVETGDVFMQLALLGEIRYG